MENKIELNGNTDPNDVEKFLRNYGWYSYNGHIRVISTSNSMQPLAVDIRQMFNIYVRETEVIDENKKHVNAVRVLMDFHGGKEMRTRIYPTESEVWKSLMLAFIWLRDYYLGLAEHEINYNLAALFEVQEKPHWDSFLGEVDTKTSSFIWTVK